MMITESGYFWATPYRPIRAAN